MIVRSCSVAPKNSGIRRLLKEMIHRNKAEIHRKNGKRFILRRSRKLRKLGQVSLLLGEPAIFGAAHPNEGQTLPKLWARCLRLWAVVPIAGQVSPKLCADHAECWAGLPRFWDTCPQRSQTLPKVWAVLPLFWAFPLLDIAERAKVT